MVVIEDWGEDVDALSLQIQMCRRHAEQGIPFQYPTTKGEPNWLKLSWSQQLRPLTVLDD